MIQCTTPKLDHRKSKSSRKTSALFTTPKPLTVWITANWKILQEMRIPDHLTCLLRNLYAGQGATESDMGKRTGSKLGKKYVKAVYCHSVSLTYMQSISCEMPGWMKHKLESRLPEEISVSSQICRWHPYGRKQRRTKELLSESERGE